MILKLHYLALIDWPIQS